MGDVALFRFTLTPSVPRAVTVSELTFNVVVDPVASFDFNSSRLVIDEDQDGTVSAAETSRLGGQPIYILMGGDGPMTFMEPFVVGPNPTHLIWWATLGDLPSGADLDIFLTAEEITCTETVTGSTTDVSHARP